MYEQFNHSFILTIEKTIYNYFILLKNGNLISIYDNNKSTIGRKINDDPKKLQKIGKVEIKERVIDIRCGEKHAIALTICGKVYTWGTNDLRQVMKIFLKIS